MVDIGIQYGACRERIVALASDLDAEQTATPVPACPGWTVHDVVAHLAGSVTDVLAGRMDGVGRPEWTGAQVDARRGTPIGDMVSEWNSASPQFEATLQAVGGPMASLGVADAWNHEQDIRAALGLEGGNDPAAEHTAIEGYAPMVGARWDAPLLVVVGDTHVRSGAGEPGATVTGAPYDLARALAGRRTEPELRALRWEGDAEPYIVTLAKMGPAEPLAL